MISDSLISYRDAVIKEIGAKRTLHIKTSSLRDGFQNRPIERWHNEVRSVTKCRRGMGNDESAQDFLDGYKIYHNYARPHMGLPYPQTPAEAANIDLLLNPQNNLKDLIVKSTEQKEISNGKFAIHLGKRVQHVEIIHEKDCSRVRPKGGLTSRYGKRSMIFSWYIVCMAVKRQR